MHALIIEDDALTTILIEDVLTEMGFATCDKTESAPEAVAAAARNRPDLITSDMQLTVGTGVEAVEAILRTHTIPVVFVTGVGHEVRERLPDAVILDKPFADVALKEAIMLCLSGMR